jgi:enoyl-CoA hydratase/carnithine racemase
VEASDLRSIRYEVTDRVGLITLNRPDRLNAWTGRMHLEYRTALEWADDDDRVRVIVVTGAGRGFCAGADSQALVGHADRGAYDDGLPPDPPRPGHGVRDEFDADFAYHFGLSTPIIAAINGPAAGVGLVLACYCDLRFAATGVKLTTAHGKLNLPAEYGLSWLLPRIVGVGRALDLLLSSRIILPDEALAWGLVNQVHTDDDLMPATLAYAERLAASVSRHSLAASKHQTYVDLHRDVGTSVTEAAARLDAMMGEPDFARGVAALNEKRSPEFD